MGRFASSQWISIALALEAHGLELREAFDVGAVSCEDLDAFEEIHERQRACRAGEGFLPGTETEPGDLVGAGADGEAQGRLVIDESDFEGDARLGIAGEICDGLVVENHVDHRGGAITQRLDALAHGVQWEEVAQDDQEPFHAVKISRPMGRLIQKLAILQIPERAV